MGPVKFADINKTAKDILDDDYQVSGFQFKNKTKTSYNGVVVTSTVDINDAEKIRTPTKLSWKFPKPFGISGISVDKLEMDKAGKFKFETTLNKDLHSVSDLDVEVKSNLVDFEKATMGVHFTGIADTLIRLDTTPLNPGNFNLELTRSFGPLTAGVKLGMANMTAPDVGARYASGPLFASLLVSKGFSVFTGHKSYKISDSLKLAATYEHGGKQSGAFCLGSHYKINDDTSVKAKVNPAGAFSITAKHLVAKGFNLMIGTSYNLASSEMGYGVQVSLE